MFLVYMNFHIKNNFHEVMVSDKMISSRIFEEEQLYITLKAELTYLTSPKNLKLLASKYLNLAPVHSSQIVKSIEPILLETKNEVKKK